MQGEPQKMDDTTSASLQANIANLERDLSTRQKKINRHIIIRPTVPPPPPPPKRKGKITQQSLPSPPALFFTKAMDIVSVPLKTTSDIDLVKPFKELIALQFSTADEPANFNYAIAELNQLRRLACVHTLRKNEASIEIIARYCDQLLSLEGKILPHDLQILFKWNDAFHSGFFSRKSLAISSISYERTCCLFNLAAFQSQVASVKSKESAKGLKCAANLLQSAARIFTSLKNQIVGVLQQELTPDLNQQTLASLSSLMLAQVHEIWVIMGISHKKNAITVAKFASQCGAFYGDALMQINRGTLSTWGKNLVSTLKRKQMAYYEIARHFQSHVYKSVKPYRRAITRRQVEFVQENCTWLSNNFKDLFDGLTPVAVHQAMAALEIRQIEIINKEVGRLREANKLLNGILHSLNLPVTSSASRSAANDSRSSAAAAQLRLLINQVNDLKSERRVLEHEIKSATIDLKQQFLSALAQNGTINEAALSLVKLGQVYDPLQKRVQETVDLQANLVQQIQVLREHKIAKAKKEPIYSMQS